MTHDLPLFAAASAEKHPLPESVLEDLYRALDYFRQLGLPFTAELLRDRCSDASRQVLLQPNYVNALGGFVQGMARGRTPRIKADGFVEAQRQSARGRPIRRWRAA